MWSTTAVLHFTLHTVLFTSYSPIADTQHFNSVYFCSAKLYTFDRLIHGQYLFSFTLFHTGNLGISRRFASIAWFITQSTLGEICCFSADSVHSVFSVLCTTPYPYLSTQFLLLKSIMAGAYNFHYTYYIYVVLILYSRLLGGSHLWGL